MSEALSLPGRVAPLAALRWHRAAPVRVLAIHGWLDNAASFAPLAEHLPDCDLVAIDLPGHGHSGHLPGGAWYHFIDYLGDALDALDALGWDDCVLLGHSLGGAIASTLAAACPQRVRRLMLVEALGPLAIAPGHAARSLRNGIAERRVAADKQKRVIPDVESAIAARLQATPMAPHSVERLVERSLEAVDGGWQWRSDPRLRLTTPARIGEAQIREWLQAIECPTLLVVAENHPPYFDPGLRDDRVACVRDIHRVVLPGRHHLHMDSPSAVAAELHAFLTRRSPSEG